MQHRQVGNMYAFMYMMSLLFIGNKSELKQWSSEKCRYLTYLKLEHI